MMVQMQQQQQQIPTQTLTKPNPFPSHFKSEIAREKKTHPTPQQHKAARKNQTNKHKLTNEPTNKLTNKLTNKQTN
jgi:hypothetical protein